MGEWGGHRNAARPLGESRQLRRLRRRRERGGQGAARREPGGLRPGIEVDAEIPLSEISNGLLDWHERLAPFGSGNYRPVFVTGGLKIVGSRQIWEGMNLLRLRAGSGRRWPERRMSCPRVLSTRHTPSTAAGTRGRPSSRSWTGGWAERHRGGRRGTKIAAGVVTPEGRILKETRYPTPASPARLVDSIARAVLEVKDGFEVDGVCLAVAGLVLAQENKVVFSPNLHAVEDIPERQAGAEDRPPPHARKRRQRRHLGRVPLRRGKRGGPPGLRRARHRDRGGVISHRMLVRGARGSAGELRTRHHPGPPAHAAPAATAVASRPSPPAQPYAAAPASWPANIPAPPSAASQPTGRCSART